MLTRRVLQCNSLRNGRRGLTICAANWTENHHNEENLQVDKLLQAETLLSEENKQRTMQCMQKKAAVFIPNLTQAATQKSAAVLICLCTDQKNEVSILYTRRSGLLTRHVRQISFPGGIKDPEDSSFVDCALRETEEEIGLPRTRINVWGHGTLIVTKQTASIMPVVASVDGFNLNELRLNADEVEEAFLVSIKDLVHPRALGHTQFKSGWSTPNFEVRPNRIWGITGFMTNAFLRCLIPMELKGLMHHNKYIRPFKHKK